MSHEALISISSLTMTMALIGFAFGLVYFAALRRTVTLFAAGRGWFVPVALTLSRIGVAILVLVLAAKLGGASLLATFIGFLLARTVALRAGRSAA
jgi:F1F0 ATPase subunit 2